MLASEVKLTRLVLACVKAAPKTGWAKLNEKDVVKALTLLYEALTHVLLKGVDASVPAWGILPLQ